MWFVTWKWLAVQDVPTTAVSLKDKFMKISLHRTYSNMLHLGETRAESPTFLPYVTSFPYEREGEERTVL